MRLCLGLLAVWTAGALLAACAAVHDATPANCPAGQEPNGALCVCTGTFDAPIDGSCDVDPRSTCRLEDCVDDGNPCTEPTCAMDATACGQEPVEDLTACEQDGADGSCMSGQCVVEEPVWELGAPFRLDGDGGALARPKVTVAADGSAIAVWLEGSSLRASRLSLSLGWDEPITLDESVDPVRLIHLDGDAAGNAIVAYARLEQSSIDIVALRFDAGLSKWGAPSVISREGAVATRPHLDVTPTGDAVLVWWEAPADILMARRAAGALSWGDAMLISPDDGFEKQPPCVSLADDGSGGVIFAGQGASGRSERAWFVALGPGEFVGAPVEIDPSTEEIQATRLAASDDGVRMAVWEQGDDIWAARSAAGVWESPSLLEAKGSGAYTPEVVSTGNGDFIAAWVQADEIRVRRYSSDGSSWEDIYIFGGSSSARRPSAMSGTQGEAWVAWYGDHRIRLRRFVPATGWGSTETVSGALVANAPSEHRPNLARGSDGTLVAVWADGTDLWTWADPR